MQQLVSVAHPGDSEPALRELDRLVEEVAELTRSPIAPAEFQQRLLERAVHATAAVGGMMWEVRPNNTLHLEHQLLLSGGGVLSDAAGVRPHGLLAAAVLQSGQPRRVPPGSRLSDGGAAGNPCEFVLLFCPLGGEGKTVGVLELLLAPAASLAAQEASLQFLADLCELAGDYYRNSELRRLRARDAFWQQSEQYALRVHGSLDLRATAFAIANEGRLLVGCDRLSVLVGRHARPRLSAVSGVDSVNRRSDTARRLERLAALAIATREAIWYDGSAAEWPPQVELAVQEHVDAAHVRTLAVIPLAASAPESGREEKRVLVGALVAEGFTADVGETWRPALEAAAAHASRALERAWEYRLLSWLPLSGVVAALGRGLTGGRRPKLLAGLLVAAVAAAALILVRADYDVKVRGELQPEVRRDIFAPSDGVILDLSAEHGRQVDAGQVVAVLRNPELDYELQRVQGELETARQRLAAVEAERVQQRVEDREHPDRYGQLTAEQEELRVRLESLQQQQVILQEQKAELAVRSPIRGQVVTWQVENRLRARPVVRGQRLLTVADLAGPWVLELQLPEDRVQPVVDISGCGQDPAAVSFLLETEASTVYHGRLRRVAMSAERDPQVGSNVLVTVDVPSEPSLPLRPGAGVIAKIHCGRRSLGYVWFGDLWNKVRSQWWF